MMTGRYWNTWVLLDEGDNDAACLWTWLLGKW